MMPLYDKARSEGSKLHEGVAKTMAGCLANSLILPIV